MSLTVRTNLAALQSTSALGRTNLSLRRTYERLSSGRRINKARDDAAGLAVAEVLDAQARSLRVAMRNANDGMAFLETAETAAEEVANIVKRMRELAVQSSSETLADRERSFLQDEFVALSSEVDRIASATTFNGVSVADGSVATIGIQVGVDNAPGNDQIQISLASLTASAVGVATATVDLSSATLAQNSISRLDTALDYVNGARSDLGAVQNRVESAIRQIDTYTRAIVSAESQVRDADFAIESAELTKFQVMQQAGVAVLAQAKNLNTSAAQLLQ